MKKILTIILAVSLLIFTSCSNNNSNKNTKVTPSKEIKQETESNMEKVSKQDSSKKEQAIEKQKKNRKKIQKNTTKAEKKQITISPNAVPNFTVTDMEGNPVSLYSLAGKIVIVDFWATWCRPCVAEIPHLNELYNKYKNQDVIFVGVALDQPIKVEAFKQKVKMDYPVWIGTQEVAQLYKVQGIPTTLVLDKDMSLYFKQVGYAPGIEKTFEQKIKELINK